MTYGELAASLEPLPRGEPIAVPARGTHEFIRLMWSAWRSEAPFVPLDPSLDGPPAPVHAGPEVRTVIFTSGTTGEPRAVGLTADNHEASARATDASPGSEVVGRWLCCMPLWHIGGLAIPIRTAYYGTTAVLHDGFDADRVREELETGGIEIVSLVGTMLRRLIDAGLTEWPGLRAAHVGGGPVPRDLLEWAAAAGFPLLQTYGMTETCSQVARLGVEEALTKTGSAGRPLNGVELRIGDGGEILVRGPMVAPGAADGDGWLHTRDRGRLDEDGFLYVEGRLDEVIVTGGENVAATEVEDVLLAHPAVADAAVAGRPDPEWGEAIVAYLVLAAAATDDELLAHCRARLPGFKVPKELRRVDGLPRNAAGKLLRARLPGYSAAP